MFWRNSFVLIIKESRIQYINYQTVRYKKRPKKPWWEGYSKTKMFVIPKVKPFLLTYPDEESTVPALEADYNHQLNSIREFLKCNDVSPEVKHIHKIEESKIQESISINDKFNQESASRRDLRLADKFEKMKEEVHRKLDKKNMQKVKQVKIAYEYMEKEKNYPFITPENIEAEVEKSLNQIVSFDYCIDSEGNKYSELFSRPFHVIQQESKMGTRTKFKPHTN